MIRGMTAPSFMDLALKTAENAGKSGEVPIGCVIVRNYEPIATAANRTLTDRDPTAHAEILAIRQAAEKKKIPLFINARTDLFLGQGNDPQSTIQAALDRANAYQAAGASGFFIPGLQEESLIARICEGTTLPVNVMVMDGIPDNEHLAEIGVARISYGPIPYINAMDTLGQETAKLY